MFENMKLISEDLSIFLPQLNVTRLHCFREENSSNELYLIRFLRVGLHKNNPLCASQLFASVKLKKQKVIQRTLFINEIIVVFFPDTLSQMFHDAINPTFQCT